MGTKRRILYLALILGTLGVLAWVVLHPREPRYQGRPLSYWLRGLDGFSRNVALNNKLPFNDPRLVDAAEAVRQMGTNAFPQLLRMLQEKDSALKLKWMALVQKQRVIKINFSRAALRNGQASRALQLLNALGVDLGPIVPDLIQICDRHISQASINHTVGVLNQLGPAAKAIVPSMERGLTNADEQVRMASIESLCIVCGVESGTVQAVLLKATNDASPIIRSVASNLLSGRLGFGLSPHSGIWFMPVFHDASADDRVDRLLTMGRAVRDHFEKVGPEVAELLQDQHPVLRQMACFSLLEIYAGYGPPPPDITAALVKTLNDPDPLVRASAARVVKQLDPAAAKKAGVQ